MALQEIPRATTSTDRSNAHKAAASESQRRRTGNPLGDFNLSIVGQDGTTPNADFYPKKRNRHGVMLHVPETGYSDQLLGEMHAQFHSTDPKTGQRLGTVFLNQEALTHDPNAPVTVYSGLYMNVIGADDESRLRILEMGKRMPDRGLVAFDYPGMGDSDNMTDAQKDTSRASGFHEIADAELRVLREMGVTRINTVGISMGGYASITLAERAHEFDIAVDNTIVIGTPGITHTPALLLGTREAMEMRSLDLYHSVPADPEMWRALHEPVPSEQQGMWEKDEWLRYARMMTKGAVPERTKRALETQPEMRVLFVTGANDRVSTVRGTNDLVVGLTSTYGDRVSQIIKPGENHLSSVHPKQLAPLVASQFVGRFI